MITIIPLVVSSIPAAATLNLLKLEIQVIPFFFCWLLKVYKSYRLNKGEKYQFQ